MNGVVCQVRIPMDDAVARACSGCACRGKVEILGLPRADPHSARIPHCCLRGDGDVGNGLPPR